MVAAVQSIQLRIFQQDLLREGLLGQSVDDDRHRRVDRVEQEQKDALEEGGAREVGVDGEHQLASEAGDLLEIKRLPPLFIH